MIARGLMIAALAVALCACASSVPERASLQSGVYVVGDNAPIVKANEVTDASEDEGQFGVIKRIYWFFAGR